MFPLPLNWAGCVKLHNLPFVFRSEKIDLPITGIRLHNFPIGFLETHQDKINFNLRISYTSVYEMQKSAANWDFSKFNFP